MIFGIIFLYSSVVFLIGRPHSLVLSVFGLMFLLKFPLIFVLLWFVRNIKIVQQRATTYSVEETKSVFAIICV